MSTNVCAVFGCTNSYANTISIKPPITFYSFPGKPHELERRKAWIRFVKRKSHDGGDYIPTKSSRICSAHFMNNEKSNHPHNPNYFPTIRPTVRSDTVDVDLTVTRTINKLNRCERAKKRRAKKSPVKSKGNKAKRVDILPTMEISDDQVNVDQLEEPKFKDQETQTDFDVKDASTQASVETQTKSVGEDERYVGFHGFRTVKQKETVLKDLTSVTLNVFLLLLNLFPREFPRTNEIGLEDKLLLTLMKLKLGISFKAVGSIFSVSGSTAQRIFSNLIIFLVQRTTSFIVWPSRVECKRLMFDCFRKDYSQCRVIIDCTELYTESPSSVENHLHLYSQYKSGCTVKYLIGMTTGGLVSFVSEAFGGRTSDAQATIKSGLLELLEPGDTVMADKGFPSITTQLADRNVTLIMPPFANPAEGQLSVESMDETCKIASARVHIERIIQRFKIYNILNNTIPLDLLPLMDDIMRFIGVLVNLQPTIVK